MYITKNVGQLCSYYKCCYYCYYSDTLSAWTITTKVQQADNKTTKSAKKAKQISVVAIARNTDFIEINVCMKEIKFISCTVSQGNLWWWGVLEKELMENSEETRRRN